jgi:hypothetical protein
MKNFADKILTFADENKAFIYFFRIYCNVLKLDTSYGCI